MLGPIMMENQALSGDKPSYFGWKYFWSGNQSTNHLEMLVKYHRETKPFVLSWYFNFDLEHWSLSSNFLFIPRKNPFLRTRNAQACFTSPTQSWAHTFVCMQSVLSVVMLLPSIKSFNNFQIWNKKRAHCHCACSMSCFLAKALCFSRTQRDKMFCWFLKEILLYFCFCSFHAKSAR